MNRSAVRGWSVVAMGAVVAVLCALLVVLVRSPSAPGAPSLHSGPSGLLVDAGGGGPDTEATGRASAASSSAGEASESWPLAPPAPSLDGRISRALDRVASCLEAHEPGVAETWILTLAEPLINDHRLARILARARTNRRSDFGAGLINPSQGRPAGSGPIRITEQGEAILDAIYCHGHPSRRVRGFVNATHSGYELTHQLLVIFWAERRPACKIPPEWEERKSALLARVRDEAAASDTFGDLFAEQLAVLELGGWTGSIERRWIERLIEGQAPTGCWIDAAAPGPDHMTSLAAYALAGYRAHLRRPDPAPPAVPQ
jgi:hypothetical protein